MICTQEAGAWKQRKRMHMHAVLLLGYARSLALPTIIKPSHNAYMHVLSQCQHVGCECGGVHVLKR